MRRLIRTDGTETPLDHPVSMLAIGLLIDADTLDTVMLKHLRGPLQVMVVDDLGMVDGKPVNAKATELYQANCRPGTTHQIRGDVVVVFDEDFS